MKKSLALLLSLMLCIGLFGCSQSAETQPTATPAAETPAPAGIYTPGTYTATAKGFGGNIEVSVTVDENAIVEVAAVGASETQGIGSNAIDQLPAQIVEAQSADVDTVSGCTVSSTALLEAAKQALAQARGETVSAAASYTPGAYTATAQGNNGAVTVETTFTADRIESIQVVEHYESQGVCEKALFTELPQSILGQPVPGCGHYRGRDGRQQCAPRSGQGLRRAGGLRRGRSDDCTPEG